MYLSTSTDRLGAAAGLGQVPPPAPTAPAPTSTPALVLDGFAFDSSRPTPSQGTLLDTLATSIVASLSTPTPVFSVALLGHTDVRGPEGYNLGLGRRRADEIARALREAIDRRRPGFSARLAFTSDSAGEARPVSRSDHARNRRVEIFVRRAPAPTPPPPAPTPRPVPAPPAPRPRDPRCPRGRFLTSGIWTRNSTLTVSGGQVMRFFLKNRNVLGTTIRITAHSGETHALVLLPMGSGEISFSMFGCEPMGWRFDIETESDVFFVEWTLCSTWVPGDPRNC